MVETGESEDVGTRVRPHCDVVQAFAELRYGVRGTHARKQCEIWAQFIFARSERID